MANLTAPDYGQKPLHHSAYGNAWIEDYGYTGAIALDDKVYFGIIPAGIRVTSVTAPADLTMGYEPVDPDGPIAGSFAALTPITFNRPVKLVGTATAAIASGAAAVVIGKMVGAP